jgi:hypothetical protein
MNPRGCPVLKLTDKQYAAVAKFLQAHPQIERYDYSPMAYADGSCLDTYQQWKMSADPQAVAQYPFAVWGDFNHDGYLDLTVFFVSKKPAVTHKYQVGDKFTYTYEHDWLVVVFQGTQNGTFAPVIAARGRWAQFMDGVIFHPGRHRIEYWVKSCGGSVQWTGTGYHAIALKCSD